MYIVAVIVIQVSSLSKAAYLGHAWSLSLSCAGQKKHPQALLVVAGGAN